jgi:hypothetical protein
MALSERDRQAIEQFAGGVGAGPAPRPSSPPPGRGPQLAGPPDWPTLRTLVNRTAADVERIRELLFHDADIWREWQRYPPGLVKLLDGKILALAREVDELRHVPDFGGLPRRPF